MTTAPKQDISKLNEFLRGELSAVETYDQCIEKFDDETGMQASLRVLRDSHSRRADKLSSHIAVLGGQPSDSSGPWGTFAKLVEGGAKLFGKSAAISALEEGEDHGNKLYQDSVDELSAPTKTFVQTQITPEQERSHEALSTLQEFV